MTNGRRHGRDNLESFLRGGGILARNTWRFIWRNSGRLRRPLGEYFLGIETHKQLRENREILRNYTAYDKSIVKDINESIEKEREYVGYFKIAPDIIELSAIVSSIVGKKPEYITAGIIVGEAMRAFGVYQIREVRNGMDALRRGFTNRYGRYR